MQQLLSTIRQLAMQYLDAIGSPSDKQNQHLDIFMVRLNDGLNDRLVLSLRHRVSGLTLGGCTVSGLTLGGCSGRVYSERVDTGWLQWAGVHEDCMAHMAHTHPQSAVSGT